VFKIATKTCLVKSMAR